MDGGNRGTCRIFWEKQLWEGCFCPCLKNCWMDSLLDLGLASKSPQAGLHVAPHTLLLPARTYSISRTFTSKFTSCCPQSLHKVPSKASVHFLTHAGPH